jgi:chromosome partitioning protein
MAIANRGRVWRVKTLAIAAQKGGVGKTTTAVHVGVALARLGVPVLVLDLDAQANATALLAPRLAALRGTADVLAKGAAIADVVISTEAGVDLCPSSEALESAELTLANEIGREQVLKEAIELAGRLDRWALCILDCPPSLGLLTANALVAADAVLSTCMPSFLSVRAVRRLETTIATVHKRLNKRLEPLGFLLCAVDEREAITEASRERLREMVGPALWSLEVRVDAQLKRAPTPDGRSRGTDDYEAIAAELMRRLELTSESTSKRTSKKAS